MEINLHKGLCVVCVLSLRGNDKLVLLTISPSIVLSDLK